MSHASFRRRAFAMLGASLLLAALPAVPAAAASEACPSSIPSAGFTDLGGLSQTAVESINCVAYYGIAKGTSATTYGPAQTVPRWQMAIFLIKAAEDLGIALPNGNSQGFTDIGGFDTATQTAINQLAQLGITKGTSPTTFAPNATVPRWQLAIFLTQLYAKTGRSMPNGVSQGFTDIGGYDAFTQKAINQLAQLGITKGTATNTFSPAMDVPRWHMAIFMAAELESGKTIPHRVQMSANPVSSPVQGSIAVTVQVTTLDNKAVSNRPVDIFVGSLDTSGRCVLDTDAKIGGGDAGTGSNCTIDSNDPKTNAFGQVTVTLTHANVLETDTIHAWVGENGENFDADVVRTRGSIQVSWTEGVTGLLVDDLNLPYGGQAQVKARLVNSQSVTVPSPGQKIVFRVVRNSSEIIKQTVLTDSSGVATLVYTGPSGTGADIVDNITAFWDKDGDGVDDGTAEFDDTAKVTWKAATPRADTAVLSHDGAGSLVGTSHTATVTVKDKFGTGIAGATVNWKVTGVTTTSGTVATNSQGKATFAWTSATPGVDVADAQVDVPATGAGIDLAYADVADLAVYWVQNAPSLPGETRFDLIGFSTAGRTIDVYDLSADEYRRLKYGDSHDTYTVGSVKDKTGFETELAKLTLPDLDGNGGTELKTDSYDAGSGASTFILTP